MVGIPVGAAPPTLTNPCVRASPTLIRFQRLSTLPKKHTSYCRSFPRLGSSQRAFCPTRLSALDKMVEPNTVAPETPTTTTSTQRNPSTPDSVLKAFAGCMPKQEIGAQRFLKDNPHADGRGIVIAIFDTGVDPGAQGLQTTPHGQPKILDVIDCTGSGDVRMDAPVNASEDHTLTSSSGRVLKVNPVWENPTGQWRMGTKRLFDLIPRSLVKRLREERKRIWSIHQRTAVSAATQELAAWKTKHGGKGGGGEEVQREKEELEARLQLLKDITPDKDDVDPGPLVELVTWHDGSHWQVAVDTSDIYIKEEDSGKGLLADFPPMTDYHVDHQWATFSPYDACNYALHIYEDGAVVSVVVDAGAHGTHVAGIAAAYHPEAPELNGIAPGAQILSCKIGDTRLGSMETGVGLTRALIAVLQHNAHVINMSYGEATTTPNHGRFVQLASELVHKHGVVFVSSAGNAGPALSTVGAPGGSAGCILGIGAYVSPDMAAVAHAVRNDMANGGQQYTWSSRGPTLDGDTGVALSAPGGAIAPVPQWCQQSRQLMNGTSMSSPNAAGGVALLLSALKAANQPWSPNRVRRALENTAVPLAVDQADSVLTYGRGMMQVDKAWQLLQRSKDVDQPDVRYDISVQAKGSSAPPGRGVYVRHDPGSLPCCYAVNVSPQVHPDADTVDERLAVENKLQLVCSASWVNKPDLLLLPFGGRGFEVEVDCSSLPPGQVHYTEVQAMDMHHPWRGPLFRVPITICLPQPLDTTTPAPRSVNAGSTPVSGKVNGQSSHAVGAGLGHPEPAVDLGALVFTPGQELRRFVQVPEGATFAELRLKVGPLAEPLGIMARMTQLLPHTRYSNTEKRAYLQLSAHDVHTLTVGVSAGTALEVTLAQFWSSMGDGVVHAQVSFFGIECTPNAIPAHESLTKLLVRSTLRTQQVKPVVKLTHVRMSLAPTDTSLTPLHSDRDLLTDGRLIHALLLTYTLDTKEAGQYTPRLPALNGFVYDGQVEAQMSMVFDGNKKRLGVSDIYPEAVKLKKGTYTIRVLLRHDDVSLLQQLQSMPLVVERTLSTPIKVPVYKSHGDALLGKNAVKDVTLLKGQRTALFIGTPTPKGLPSDATQECPLVGRVVLMNTPNGGNGNGGDAPGWVPIVVLPPPKGESEGGKKNGTTTTTEDQPTPDQKYQEALRDAKVSFLKSLVFSIDNTPAEEKEAAALYGELREGLLKQYPTHLPLLLEWLKRLESDSNRTNHLQDIVDAADTILSVIDTTVLACYLVSKAPEEGPGAAAVKKRMDEQKGALIEALDAKARALLDLHPEGPVKGEGGVEEKGKGDKGEKSGKESAAEDAFEVAYAELRKWVDVNDAPYALLSAQREARRGRYACAIKALDKLIDADDKPPAKRAVELKVELLGKLGWAHLARLGKAQLLESFPASYDSA